MQRSIEDLEQILSRISTQYEESQKAYLEIFAECNRALCQTKEELHLLYNEATVCGYEPLPAIHLNDPKLVAAWNALYWHHDGATADTIAEYLGKHRTTVSTYLNILVAENLAQKKRIGHEIYYKAIIQREE